MFLSVVSSAKSNSSTSPPRPLLSVFKSVSGQFKQEKEIKRLKLTLKSYGRFEMAPGKLVWIQRAPIKGRYEVNQQEMRQTVEGQPEQVVSRQKVPELALLSDMMTCALSGDPKCLEKSFTTTEVQIKDRDNWTFTLKPKDKWIKRVLLAMKIKGGKKFVREISIIEKSGNTSVISFYNIRGR